MFLSGPPYRQMHSGLNWFELFKKSVFMIDSLHPLVTKNQKYIGKKMTFLRIFWLRAKSHHSIFPWSFDLMISNLISTSFYFVIKKFEFSTPYTFWLKNYGYFKNQIKPYQVKVEYILKKRIIIILRTNIELLARSVLQDTPCT